MDKFRGDLLKVLTSLEQRLGGLETHTDTLAQQVGELHRVGAQGRQQTCDRLAALETTSADVARKLRLLQDKMVRMPAPPTTIETTPHSLPIASKRRPAHR
jgi:hypothetical protein